MVGDAHNYLRDAARKDLYVIKRIFGVKRGSLQILNQKLSETPRCPEESVEPLLLEESMEDDLHDYVLACDHAEKVLWVS